MTGFDYTILGIIGFSVILSVMRGFIKEGLSLVSWAVAFYVAKRFTLQVAPLLPDSIPSEGLRFLAAFVILFLLTLLVLTLLAIAISQIFKTVGFGWLDRLLGAGFGLVRGLCITLLLVFLAGFTNIPKEQSWSNAMFSAPLEEMVKKLLPWIPEPIAKHVNYE